MQIINSSYWLFPKYFWQTQDTFWQYAVSFRQTEEESYFLVEELNHGQLQACLRMSVGHFGTQCCTSFEKTKQQLAWAVGATSIILPSLPNNSRCWETQVMSSSAIVFGGVVVDVGDAASIPTTHYAEMSRLFALQKFWKFNFDLNNKYAGGGGSQHDICSLCEGTHAQSTVQKRFNLIIHTKTPPAAYGL